MKKFKYLLVLLLICLLPVVWTIVTGYYQNMKNLSHLRPEKAADDVAHAVRTGKVKFLAIRSAAADVPGVLGGTVNLMVKQVGYEFIEAIRDDKTFLKPEDESRIIEYAAVFNQSLLHYLLTSKQHDYVQVSSAIDRELSRWERLQPRTFLQTGIVKKDLEFVIVIDARLGVLSSAPGVSQQDLERYSNNLNYQVGQNLLYSTPDLMNQQQKKRYNRLFKNFIIPYNKLLLFHLKSAP